MNFDYAIEILDLNRTFTSVQLRKAYLKKTLIYHPDKNRNGAMMFHKVKDSYDFLQKYVNQDKTPNIDTHNNEYIDILQKFIRTMQNDVLKNIDAHSIDLFFKKVTDIIQSLYNNTQEDALNIFKNVDTKYSFILYKLINKYKNLFNIPNEFLSKLRENINKKYDELPIITIDVSIDDVLKGNIYIYKDEYNTYYIPLWHEELYFKKHIIRININNIDGDITIDDNNNIIVNKYLNIQELIHNENIEIYIGTNLFIVNRSRLRLVDYQKITLYSSGIPLINDKDMYDVEKKGNIVISFHIKFPTL